MSIDDIRTRLRGALLSAFGFALAGARAAEGDSASYSYSKEEFVT